jgi:hypothetical protein
VEVKTKNKIHTKYKTDDGLDVPGVTTIIGVLAKPALIHWAWNLGCQGIDYRKERDSKGDIGTLAHLMIMEYLKKEKYDYSEYSKAEIDKAENCLISFYEWLKHNEIKAVQVETPMTSNLYGYGGTVDCYCWLNNEPTLIDFKTGKAIYDEMFYQVAAYKQLLSEHKKEVSQVRIVRIGRNEDEGFEDHKVDKLDDYWNVFFYCLQIYKTIKKIKRGDLIE